MYKPIEILAKICNDLIGSARICVRAFKNQNSPFGGTMNKADLVQAVAAAAEMSKADATRAIDAVLDSISEALKKEDQVTLIGFGTFSVRERAARIGRNPRTKEAIDIKAAKVPSFKAGKALKDAVNESSSKK